MLNKLKNIGPGAMVAAAFIGPGTVTTATIAGSSFGYTLLWAVGFSIVATFVLQEMSARLGVMGQMGVGEAIRSKVNKRWLFLVVAALVIGAILIGNAAYEAGNITGAVLGFEVDWPALPFNPLILLIGVVAFLLLWSGRYKLIEKSLVLLVSVMGVVFIAAAIILKPDLSSTLVGLFVPAAPQGSMIMIVSLIGTTVVPYNLFLHASTVKTRWQDSADLTTARTDTLISVVGGGLITMAILITSAIAFQGVDQEVNSASDLALQLRPLLGSWSGSFIAVGFLAAGLSSSITAPLAAAYATSEILGWKEDLQGKKFRIIWLLVLGAGVLFSSLGFRPTLVILFAQFTNGLLLPVVATFLLWIMNDHRIMGVHYNNLWTNILGILVIIATIVLGVKSVLSATSLL
ncbi:MAG: Nramp family divalent metal transporter [Cyclobacteriaceae bacterium]|nr:Nramp family divalent metal transporter [Cyclobacteriaceae bacterium]